MREIFYIFLIVIFVSCSTTKYNLKYTDNFNLKSEPVNVKYKIKLGQPIEGKASITKILFFLRFPNSLKISENVYSTNQSTPTMTLGGAEIIGLSQPFTSLSGILAIFQPLVNLFTSSNEMIEMSKSAAVYKACEKNNYNVILTPIYECKLKDYFIFKRVTTIVKGVGANISKIIVEDENKEITADCIVPVIKENE